jgi:hypothetical protein
LKKEHLNIDLSDYGIQVNIELTEEYTLFLKNFKNSYYFFEDEKDVIFSKIDVIEHFEFFVEYFDLINKDIFNFIPIAFKNYDFLCLDLNTGNILKPIKNVSYEDWMIEYNDLEELLSEFNVNNF